ncbi:hypothetical protein [Streptacidiphilus anmyonensis]|uniref:hypothetical protein n=1 Tax=Streptacidiphilus anmyonensis TaxID=405782 RepID=UPI000693C003|nr:hypothetical protein [Streptacidiphilus anmyonensis]
MAQPRLAARPGVLWIATPEGSLLEVDVETREATEHHGPSDSRLTALTVTPTGELLIATDRGELFLLCVLTSAAPTTTDASDGHELAKAAATAFLAATSELPADGDLESDLILTDGTRTWEGQDLSTVTEAAPTDPTWQRLRAAVNKVLTEGA